MSLKLYYWEFKGRAVDIRTLLSYLKVNYQEIILKGEEWGGLQKSLSDSGFNFPNLPMIDDGGFKLSESKAVLAYLAESKGNYTLLGKTPQDRAIVRQIEGVDNEIRELILKNIFSPDYKANIQELARNEKLLRAVKRLEQHFSDGRRFAVGYLTIADIVIANAYKLLNHVFKSAGLKNPTENKILYDHAIRMDNLPGVREYYTSDEYKNRIFFPMPWFKEHPLTAPAN